MPLVNPEYVDENGKRTPLSAPVLVHFPSDRVGLTWCGLPFDPSEGGTFVDYSTDKRGLRFSTDMRLVTCPACDTEAPVYPHDLAPSEVALAKILAAVEEYDATAAPWRNLDASVFAGLDYAADGLCVVGLRAASYLTPQGRALLDRARRAGVL